MQGPVILIKGASMWDGGPKRDAFSATVGSILTLKGLLFSWWWDTLCLPYDFYLRCNGVDFYVYDQDGQPIPDVRIHGYGEDAFCGIEGSTDAKGHLYYPRHVKGFTSLSATKEGYWSAGQGDTFWLGLNSGDGRPQMLQPKFRSCAVGVPTTNDMHTVNFFMKKIPGRMPVVSACELVVSNFVAGVEYGIDLSNGELASPFGPGGHSDVRFKVLDDEITSHRRVRCSMFIWSDHPKVLPLVNDGSRGWPYLYYAPPGSAFDTVGTKDALKMPVMVSMSDSIDAGERYAFIVSGGVDQYRQIGDPLCFHLRYWFVEPLEDKVLVCDHRSRARKKLIVPSHGGLNVKKNRDEKEAP